MASIFKWILSVIAAVLLLLLLGGASVAILAFLVISVLLISVVGTAYVIRQAMEESDPQEEPEPTKTD